MPIDKLPLKGLIILTTLVVILITAFSLPTTTRADARSASDPSVIRITPAAPLIDDHARLSELANRRAHVAQSIGSKAMLVLFSAEPRLVHQRCKLSVPPGKRSLLPDPAKAGRGNAGFAARKRSHA